MSKRRRHAATELVRGRSCWGSEDGTVSPSVTHRPQATRCQPPFCVSDSALAMKHFRQACPRAETPWVFPESHSPRNHFCLGEHHPASHFYPTKDPVGPRGPRACNAVGTPVICKPHGRKNRAQRATTSLPAQGGKSSPPSAATSTNPLHFQQVSKGICALANNRNARGRELIAS